MNLSADPGAGAPSAALGRDGGGVIRIRPRPRSALTAAAWFAVPAAVGVARLLTAREYLPVVVGGCVYVAAGLAWFLGTVLWTDGNRAGAVSAFFFRRSVALTDVAELRHDEGFFGRRLRFLSADGRRLLSVVVDHVAAEDLERFAAATGRRLIGGDAEPR